MKALITGASGFIGSHLAQWLRGQGWGVAATDWHSAPPTVDFLDVTNPASVDEYICGHHPDVVFHLAAAVGPETVEKMSASYIMDVNVLGTQNVVDAALAHGVKRVVFTSTSEVYGPHPTIPFREDTSILSVYPSTFPRSAYPVSKLAAEHIVRDSGIGVVARVFNTAGPGQSMEYVIPRMVEAALNGFPLQVMGDGLQTRCFCHVADTVRALELLGTAPGIEGQVYNVGNDVEISVKLLAHTVAETLGVRLQRIAIPMRQGERKYRRVPDTLRLRRLGWRPEKSLRDIILDVAEHQKASADG